VKVETGTTGAPVAKRAGRREKGSSLIEFALVMTFLLVPTVVGLAEFATYLNNYLALTDAVATGARTVAINRGITLNPCSLVGAAVTTSYQAAAIESGTPSLVFTITLNNGAVSQGPWTGSTGPGGCGNASPYAGVPGDLIQGTAVTVNAKFTPTLIFNVFPNMQIQAQTTEIVQ
jgi:Flp pilus assembly protein TadG